MKAKYWWALIAATAIMVGINMCGDNGSHSPSGATSLITVPNSQ